MILLLALACRPDDDPEPTYVGDVLMVVETGRSQITLLDRDEFVARGSQCLYELFPDDCRPVPKSSVAECLPFGVDHELVDGEDSLRMTWSRRDEDVDAGLPGRLTRFAPGHLPEEIWSVEGLDYGDLPTYRGGACVEDAEGWVQGCGLNMTHVTEPTPDGAAWVMADTLNSRVVWLDREQDGRVLAVLDEEHPDWDGFLYANNVQVFEEDGGTWLLVTFKSGSGNETRNTGRITLWEVSDPSAPVLRWAYPSDGHIAAVHHGRRVEVEGRAYLLYAHSLGASESFEGFHGAVGLAEFSLEGPTYLGDGILPEGPEGFGFVREVELSPEGDSLYVVDSGCENPDIEDCTLTGRIVEVEFPSWEPEGLSGAFSVHHAEQSLRTLSVLEDVWGQELSFPFEVDVVLEEDQGETFSSSFGACPKDL
jgi:hypothetical protein